MSGNGTELCAWQVAAASASADSAFELMTGAKNVRGHLMLPTADGHRVVTMSLECMMMRILIAGGHGCGLHREGVDGT